MPLPQLVASHDPALAPLVHGKERLYYALMIVASLGLYAVFVLALIGSAATPQTGVGVFGFYGIMGALAVFMMHGLFIGRLRGNGVRVSARQFPTLHRLVREHAARLGL